MLQGYRNNVAFVDLPGQKVDFRNFEESTIRKYIGGSGLAARILWDETNGSTEPLSEENLLMFMVGPLTGSIVPSSSRYTIVSISPLTGIWGKATAGGKFAYEMKHAGFDGIVIKGKSEKPVYLWLNDGKVFIRDAVQLWGKDTYETTACIRQETDEKAGVACIGQAGENLVKVACIMGDGTSGRAAARCGLGAIMGFKNLKAIVARGNRPVDVYDAEGLKENVKQLFFTYPPRLKKE